MFFRSIVAALGVIVLVLLVLLLWPRNHVEPVAVEAFPSVPEPAPPAPRPQPVKIAPPAPPPPIVRAAPAAPEAGRPQDQMEVVESCAGKPCGTPCVIRCDPSKDYATCERAGVKSGQCNADSECTTMLPPICPPR
jgi:hypothetical protein